MHLAPLIRDLAIILGVAGLISLLFQRIRQPVVLGYIIAGIIIGPHTPPVQLVTDIPSINTWAELGVIFLMFTLGLEFSFRKLARVGGSSVVTAGTEVMFFLPVGYLVGKGLGWTSMDSLFLGAMLSISSTTIIIKALDELKLKRHRFAELIFGALIVEDLFAILLLVALGTVVASQAFSASALLGAALKLVLVVGGWFIAGYFAVPRFMRYVGRIGSDEILTLLSLGLCLGLVVFADHFHYSTALGAFIMGSILAESPVLPRIERNMASLRDLFGAIFFVSIGMLIDPRLLWTHLGAVSILCAVTIAGKIVSTGFGALVSGQTLRNSVQVGFGLAQIGEFSFIIARLGSGSKATSEFLYPVAVAVSLVTTFTTPYLIRVSGRAAEAVERNLPERARDLLTRYAAVAEARRAGAAKQQSLAGPLLRWLVNGLIVSLLFVLVSKALLPLLAQKSAIGARLLPFLGWCGAILMSSPFLWAMLTAFRAPRADGNAPSPTVRALSKALTLAWVTALSAEFFPGRYIAAATAAALLAAFVFFYSRLESVYRWFESTFLSTFEESSARAAHAESDQHRFSHLAPWDAHLIRMEIHPNSKLVLQKISDAALRVRYGVNIVAIQRGRRSIITPLPSEPLLPGDELILLGTDEQVEKMRQELEEPVDPARGLSAEAAYELRRAQLPATSAFVDRSIRQSGFRENFRAMVVGIERAGTRSINPDSDLTLREGDVLWIAGEKSLLDQLVSAIGAPADHRGPSPA